MKTLKGLINQFKVFDNKFNWYHQSNGINSLNIKHDNFWTIQTSAAPKKVLHDCSLYKKIVSMKNNLRKSLFHLQLKSQG